MVLGGLLVSLAENKKAEIGDNETSLSHIGEADHQTDHDPDQRNNQAGNLGALAPAGIAVLVSWLGRPLGRLGGAVRFRPASETGRAFCPGSTWEGQLGSSVWCRV